MVRWYYMTVRGWNSVSACTHACSGGCAYTSAVRRTPSRRRIRRSTTVRAGTVSSPLAPRGLVVAIPPPLHAYRSTVPLYPGCVSAIPRPQTACPRTLSLHVAVNNECEPQRNVSSQSSDSLTAPALSTHPASRNSRTKGGTYTENYTRQTSIPLFRAHVPGCGHVKMYC